MWHSRHWDEAVVGKKCGDLGSAYNPGASKNTNLFMLCGYTNGVNLMTRMTPSADVEDNDDRHHARSC